MQQNVKYYQELRINFTGSDELAQYIDKRCKEVEELEGGKANITRTDFIRYLLWNDGFRPKNDSFRKKFL